MTSLSPETLLIAGSEFNLSVNLLPDFLTAYRVKLDERKDYTAVWGLNFKDNHLYWKAFHAYIDSKEIILNDLFPDLFSTPSPVKAHWVTGKIEVEFRKEKYLPPKLLNYLIIQLDKGYVSHIFHKQVLLNYNTNKILEETKEEISHERLFELTNVLQNLSWNDRYVYESIAYGWSVNFIKRVLCKDKEVEDSILHIVSHRLILTEIFRHILVLKSQKKYESIEKEDEEQFYQYTGVEYKDYIDSFWHSLDKNGNPLIEKKEVIQLHYHHMSGAGTIICNDCGYKEDIVAFIHSFDNEGNPFDGRSGHQCQSCGKFHTIEIERAVKPYICSCGGELSRDKILFCSRCKSRNVEYACHYIT